MPRIKRTKEQIRRRSMYGLKKVAKGQKICWISKENKHGWSLGLGLGGQTIWLKNVRFASFKEVKRALLKTSRLFVHLKSSKAEVERGKN